MCPRLAALQVILFALFALNGAAETVRIGYRDYWPLTYRVGGSVATGFVVDVMERAAARDNIRLEWVYHPRPASIAVRNGTVRIWPVNPSPDPEAEGLFESEPWWRSGYQLMVRADSPYQTAADFRGASLALKNYPMHRSTAERFVPEASLKLYGSVRDAVDAFCRGEVDGALLGYFQAQNLFLDRPETCHSVAIRAIPLPGAFIGLSMLSQPNDRDLVLRLYRRVEELARDGSMAELLDRHPAAASGVSVHMAKLDRLNYERKMLRLGFAGISFGVLLSGLLWGKFSKDMARRRRAERLLNLQNQALEQATEGIAILDMNGRFGYANSAFSSLHGYEDGALVGQHIDVLSHPDSSTQSASWVAALIREGKHEGQVRNARKDGTAFPMRIAASILRDESGKPAGVIVVGHDITRETRLEEQLRQSQRMEAVGRLAGGVAHDFNNYLTVILGYSELALAAPASEATMRSSLGEIKAAGERAADLTRQLLAFGRRQMIHPVLLDLNAVVCETENMLRRLLVTEIKVVSNLDPDLRRIKADATQLQQVLLNLAVNAQHAMPEGGTLTISTANWELSADTPELPAGRYARICVADTGSGMTPEVAERIFEPFFTTKAQGYGTGLGLAIVYGIVKQSQGHITVETAPGRGTTFQILWPQLDAPEEAPEESSHAPAVHGSESILVVDDQTEIRALAAHILRQYGYRVLEASDYAEAESIAEREHLDLLLTDVILTGPNGTQVATRLRVLHPALRVVYMSGYSEDIIARRGVPNEDVVVIQKPFTPESLAARVGEALARA